MIKIIAVGKVKNPNIDGLTSEFIKRISKYTKLEVSIVKEEKIKVNEAKKEEGKRILDLLSKKHAPIYCLDVKGVELTSEEFAKTLKEKNACFVIGGYSGLSEEVLAKATKIISISKMTFTHEFALLLLSEQIYRGFTILNNENYHK
ncbi:MAG: 23S rRNA (pseudouridine(1915)-N(3))-methyltransferase RlmH [archaeon]